MNHCKACDCRMDIKTRSVQDELGQTHIMWEDLCSVCVLASTFRYSDEDLRDIYEGVRYANFKTLS